MQLAPTTTAVPRCIIPSSTPAMAVCNSRRLVGAIERTSVAHPRCAGSRRYRLVVIGLQRWRYRHPSIPESSVVGLIADLGARPLKGMSYAAGSVAVVDPTGTLSSVTGTPSDCVHVDGSSGPCGGTQPSFIDSEALSGIVDGAQQPLRDFDRAADPATSLSIYRNGMLQKAGRIFSVTEAVPCSSSPAPRRSPAIPSWPATGLELASGGTSQLYPSSQVLCSGDRDRRQYYDLDHRRDMLIPGGLLAAGDRVQIQFELEHQGTAGGFTFNLAWGATSLVQRSGRPRRRAAECACRCSHHLRRRAVRQPESWGTVLPLPAAVLKASDSYPAASRSTSRDWWRRPATRSPCEDISWCDCRSPRTNKPGG